MTEPADPRRDLAGALHDISNALTVLLGWVGEARAPGATAEHVAYALTIVDQRARIARDLARRAIGSPCTDEQRELTGVVAELVQGIRVEAARTGVKIAVRGADVTGGRVAGALDLSQVLTNLVLNALAHAPSGTRVEIALSLEDEHCVIVVADEGPGVVTERRDRIFAGDSLRPGGAGVGLRHSRALARSCGGEVELLADPAAGNGARFRVRWPRADVVPRPPGAPPRVPASDLSGLRVLVVEDDEAVTQLLEATLSGRGAEVTVATTTAAFASSLARGPYDAALLDLSPIAEDVAGALARLRASSPGAEVVLITGQVDALPDAILAERVEVVRKPFELREIIAALASKGR